MVGNRFFIASTDIFAERNAQLILLLRNSFSQDGYCGSKQSKEYVTHRWQKLNGNNSRPLGWIIWQKAASRLGNCRSRRRRNFRAQRAARINDRLFKGLSTSLTPTSFSARCIILTRGSQCTCSY